MGLWASFSFPSQRRAGSMSKPPYRVLRIVLGFLSLLLAVAGVLLIFSSKPLIMRMFMYPPESEISTLLLASSDPERNVAVVDGMTMGLCILAITPLISLYTLDVQRLYPGYLIWARSLVRLALAGVLYYLRPREAHWKPAGH